MSRAGPNKRVGHSELDEAIDSYYPISNGGCLMSPDAHDRCCCSGKMREGRHDFMARVGDEIVVIKDVPALICDTCGEIEYTLEVSREIDVIMKDFFAGGCWQSPWRQGRSYLSPSVQIRLHEHLFPPRNSQ